MLFIKVTKKLYKSFVQECLYMQVWRIGHFWVVFCKSLCETIHMVKDLFPRQFIFMQIKLIFVWEILHKDSFWIRGTT